MTVSSSAADYTAPKGYTPPSFDGVTYQTPTTGYTVDENGRVVLTTTPKAGMEGLTGRNTSGKTPSEFDGEMFLKLLVAQLKYQDPSKPTDTSALMQQTATLSMVERINAMAESNEAMQKTYASMLAEQRISSSVGLVGRTVVYATDPQDVTKTAEGVVESVKFDGTGPILSVGGKDVPYNDVTSVKAPTPGSPPSGSPSASGTSGAPNGTSGAPNDTTGATDGTPSDSPSA